MRKISRACLALLLLSLMGSHVMVDDPVIAPGRDPGGTPIAVVSDGFDYKNTELALILARDGEGEAIAMDAAYGDQRPYRRDGKGTKNALAAATSGGVRIVMVGVDWGGPSPLGKASAFTQRTPARIALVPLDGTRKYLDMLTAIATNTKELLFVASIPAATPEEKAKTDGVATLVLLDSKDDELIAAKAIARALGCGQAPLAGSNGAELKTAFLARLQTQPPAGCEPESARKSN
ncbi:hypothetical protein [Hyphomicrobium sp.]|uniref:hypothetical protein n=1 Tax=Hyphomicrobium sp. TaxID=82 RepID=UPI002E32E331|nr:hypothetical protein [Hyphomicrobium sp.]HEX2841445.1 hypothetical protein [Hyphomicrobium sp.]